MTLPILLAENSVNQRLPSGPRVTSTAHAPSDSRQMSSRRLASVASVVPHAARRPTPGAPPLCDGPPRFYNLDVQMQEELG